MIIHFKYNIYQEQKKKIIKDSKILNAMSWNEDSSVPMVLPCTETQPRRILQSLDPTARNIA